MALPAIYFKIILPLTHQARRSGRRYFQYRSYYGLGSNPIWVMEIFQRLFNVCAGTSLAMASPFVQEVV